MRLTPFKILMGIAASVPVLLAASSAHGQAFAGGAPTAFTPQISIVNTGSVNDVQATVSADEKYVTLTMRPSISRLLALRSFTFQQGVTQTAGGFVGMPETAQDASATPARTPDRSMPWPSAHASVSILQRHGMIKITQLSTTQPASASK